MLNFDGHTLRELMAESYRVAAGSIDPSTQNGALIVNEAATIVASGTNHPVSGVEPRDWAQFRDDKLKLFEHAERAAIYDAAAHGIMLNGLMMVCSWAACFECARALIETGIKALVIHQPRMLLAAGEWQPSIDQAEKMLKGAGIMLYKLSESIAVAPVIRHGGRYWSPSTLNFQLSP